ncbi:MULTISPECIES: trypsin-like peptidase domain-containing protein [unclassified Corynebacterium]|uniref:trypsin-like peptidase domain-containing protein n=1 Tax=unclassified Corynebacterium TaxID=2624378 RepID=UPI0029CA26B7|nr:MULTISPECIES: trypsin-like peptidase domain-containing protein [unclassified Corynebacterium]WPF66873.1 trypsin-like serine protease [Corynebacterium sp. 22KM0430]WPF69361.1 trypsin-like serine protease [Corynebacterium sp. 21KM1197]
MKRVTAAGLAAVMATLCSVAPASARPGPTLHQGGMIKTLISNCSVTLVSNKTAYTSKHCGNGVWTEGTRVTNMRGQVIGTIDGIGSSTGREPIDAIRIRIADNVRVVGAAPTRDASTMKVGERIQAVGSMSRATGRFSDTRRVLVNNTNYPSVVINSDVVSVGGDSGGAILDGQGRVIGIIKGGKTARDTYFVPIDLVEKYLPAHS